MREIRTGSWSGSWRGRARWLKADFSWCFDLWLRIWKQYSANHRVGASVFYYPQGVVYYSQGFGVGRWSKGRNCLGKWAMGYWAGSVLFLFWVQTMFGGQGSSIYIHIYMVQRIRYRYLRKGGVVRVQPGGWSEDPAVRSPEATDIIPPGRWDEWFWPFPSPLATFASASACIPAREGWCIIY